MILILLMATLVRITPQLNRSLSVRIDGVVVIVK